MSDEEGLSAEEIILRRHKKEAKLLQANIQQLKKSVNKDKKRKREVDIEIAALEKDLRDRHASEMAEFKEDKAKETELSPENLESLHIGNENEAEPSDEENTPVEITKKISRAERKRQKKALESREREQRIREANEANRFCARNVEVDKMKKILKERNLRMHEISPDGNCLFAAVSHQLNDGCTVGGLRTKASNYLRANADDFLPFITDPSSGDLLTPLQFEEYCHQLQTTPAWGGQPELRALSQVLKKRIEVLQAEGCPIVFGDEFDKKEKNILLVYYRHYYGLGEHYNSVKPLVSKEEDNV